MNYCPVITKINHISGTDSGWTQNVVKSQYLLIRKLKKAQQGCQTIRHKRERRTQIFPDETQVIEIDARQEDEDETKT